MRILHFIWSANFGGIEKLVLSLSIEQMKGDTTPHILIGCRKGELISSISESGVPFTFAGLKNGFDFNISRYNEIVKLMKDYDIIHMHTFNPLIARAAIKSRKKIIYTVHGNFNLGRKPRINDHIMNLLRSIFLRRSDVQVTFNSKWAKETAVTKYRLKDRDLTVIYNGILPEIQLNEASNDRNDFKSRVKNNFIVGTAGRFNQSKAIDRLIRSFASFAKNIDNTSLLLVGDGSERPYLENLVDQLGIRDKTTFTGFKSNVGEWQSLMDVCVIPGKFEAFGLAALETMQKGIPTFVFKDAGGMLEVLGDDLSEYVISSEADLSEKLKDFYSYRKDQDETRKSKLRERAGLFTFDKMVSNYKNCYVKILHTSDKR